MDWSKAKTVLIIALLVTNLILCGVLVQDSINESISERNSADDILEYANQLGITIKDKVTTSRPKLPLLFVKFVDANAEDTVWAMYKDYKVETSEYPALAPMLVSVGDVKTKVSTASSALLKHISSMRAAGVPKDYYIFSIELTYYVEPDGMILSAEDTAFPCWKIESNTGTYYINAVE